MRLLVFVVFFHSLVSFVDGDAASAARGAAENVFEVLYGRGQFAEIQKIMSEQVFVHGSTIFCCFFK